MDTGGENADLDHLKYLFENGDEAIRTRIADFFPGIVYVYDTDSRKLRYINKRLTDFLGYDYDDLKSWDDDVLRLVFKEDVDRVKQELEKFQDLKNSDSYAYDCRLNHKRGDWRYFRTMGTVLRKDDSGRPASLLFVAQDITDQMKSDEELRKTKELFRETERMLHYGIFEWNLQSDVLKWSDGLFDLLEAAPAHPDVQLNAGSYFSYVHSGDINDLKKKMEEHQQSLVDLDHDHRVTTSKGREKRVQFKAKFIPDDEGKAVKVMGTITEITDLHSLYTELLHHKRQAEEHEELLKFGTWENDITTQSIQWSRGMYLLFGYDPDDKVNLPEVNLALYDKHLADKGERDRVTKGRADIIANKNEYFFDFVIIDNHGIRKEMETLGTVIRDEKGKAIKIMGKTRDVSIIKLYEKSLEEKVQELDRSNKDLEEFAYVASHDLQEPLRRINTFGDRFMQKFGSQVPEEGRVYLERMMAASTNMAMLIDSLLSFSRVTRSVKSFEPADLNKIVNEATVDLEQDIRESGAEIRKEALPVIDGIPIQMKQLFVNLISNSIKFRKKEATPLITISSSLVYGRDPGELTNMGVDRFHQIRFSDNGIGFEKEYSEKIFMIFHRLHGKVEYPGSGIGLAICKRIVENHKGAIHAESEAGEGATFIITLPAKQ